MESNELTIRLNKDEALVLFEFLSRFNKNNNNEMFQDQAEEKTLWVIEGQLEKMLVEPFMPDYKDIIQNARNRVRNKE
jgi:hypothetical protein